MVVESSEQLAQRSSEMTQATATTNYSGYSDTEFGSDCPNAVPAHWVQAHTESVEEYYTWEIEEAAGSEFEIGSDEWTEAMELAESLYPEAY